MSGHSKWATIKRKKGATDAARGSLFTKLIREIAVAAKEGGADHTTNFRLRLAVQRAKAENMPSENIDRAIKRGAGLGNEGVSYEEIFYEGYGPHGTALIVLTLTDNRNRTIGDVRSSFSKLGGTLGESGSVAWMFDQKGVITVDPGKMDPEELALLAIDAGADDVKIDTDIVEVFTPFTDFKKVQDALESAKVKILSAERAMLPKTTVSLEADIASKTLKLMDRLEELDDVQQVFTNLEITEEAMEQLGA